MCGLPADTPARGFNLWPKMTMMWQHFIKTDTNNFYWAVTKRESIMIGIAKKWLRFIYVYEVTFTGDKGALKNLRHGSAMNWTCCTHSLQITLLKFQRWNENEELKHYGNNNFIFCLCNINDPWKICGLNE